MKKTSPGRGEDGAGIVPIATSTYKIDMPSVVNDGADRCVRLRKVKAMVDRAVIKLEKKRDNRVAKIEVKTVIDATEMCAGDGQHEPVG